MSDNTDQIANLQPPGGNPLQKHFRQPKIYLRLPSGGRYWAKGSLDLPENGEVPVFAMTAKDEIVMKTPDALMNGQSTVDVIQSCIPSIKDAWQCPSIDLDAILVAIRIATFGEKIVVKGKVPNTDMEKEFDLNLRTLLDQYLAMEYEDVIQAEEFLVQVRPMNYKQFTQIATKTFEEQRVLSIVNDNTISEAEKLDRFSKTFKNITALNVTMIADSINAIQYKEEDPVTNKQHIREFIENADSGVFNTIKKHVEELRDRFTSQPIDVEATPEEIEAGAPAKYQVPMQFDHSNFFGSGS